MTMEPGIAQRLQFLVRVVRKECQHLATTDQRLFGSLFTLESVRSASGRFAETCRLDAVSKDNGLSLLLPIVTTCFSG